MWERCTQNKKASRAYLHNWLILLARPGGFEPPAKSLEGSCSFQLSYGRVKAKMNSRARAHGQGGSLTGENAEGVQPSHGDRKACHARTGHMPNGTTRLCFRPCVRGYRCRSRTANSSTVRVSYAGAQRVRRLVAPMVSAAFMCDGTSMSGALSTRPAPLLPSSRTRTLDVQRASA